MLTSNMSHVRPSLKPQSAQTADILHPPPFPCHAQDSTCLLTPICLSLAGRISSRFYTQTAHFIGALFIRIRNSLRAYVLDGASVVALSCRAPVVLIWLCTLTSFRAASKAPDAQNSKCVATCSNLLVLCFLGRCGRWLVPNLIYLV